MKIVFTGGGTGGHFYPIIAVAEKVNKIIDDEHILGAKLYYFSDSPYDKEMLAQNGLFYEEINSGKMRTYFSFQNFSDIFKTFFGPLMRFLKCFPFIRMLFLVKADMLLFRRIFAARILRIPVVIHESDSAPGRVNKWAGSILPKRWLISFPEAAEYFPKEKTAWTGQPIIAEIENKASQNEALSIFQI